MSENVLELKNVTRTYKQGGIALPVLKGLNLEIAAGEAVALVGQSGTGKTTLLQIAGLLEKPDGGEVIICGKSCGKLSDSARTSIRQKHIGFVFQFHHLLPEFSALENIMMPLLIAGTPKSKAKAEAMDMLASLGLQDRAEHRPARLSGGEQQRVAILRALATRPSLILADEPTGNLDPENSNIVFALFRDLIKSHNISALIATHNMDLASKLDRVHTLGVG